MKNLINKYSCLFVLFFFLGCGNYNKNSDITPNLFTEQFFDEWYNKSIDYINCCDKMEIKDNGIKKLNDIKRLNLRQLVLKKLKQLILAEQSVKTIMIHENYLSHDKIFIYTVWLNKSKICYIFSIDAKENIGDNDVVYKIADYSKGPLYLDPNLKSIHKEPCCWQSKDLHSFNTNFVCYIEIIKEKEKIAISDIYAVIF